MGLAIIASLGYREVGIILQGDSITALSWCDRKSFKGGRSERACIAYMQLLSRFDFTIEHIEHLPGILNIESDQLSRDKTPAQLGFNASVIYDVKDNSTLGQWLAQMDPTITLDLRTGLPELWSINSDLLDVLGSSGGGWDPAMPEDQEQPDDGHN
jgi:hypothetical protein